ncbi:Uncharacterised protein [Mannheimia haemolytica]|uniref:Uncharacterized protein n=1 Tax=Mannheimia haemolytica TaxID=75985 RepID=A0A378MY17_MANHA|nr:Uncharacterised protein [Mannheimia haemolytica]
MSLLKKAQTFISIFNEVRAKNEAQRQSSNNLNVALKNAAEMRAEMNGFSLKPQSVLLTLLTIMVVVFMQ